MRKLVLYASAAILFGGLLMTKLSAGAMAQSAEPGWGQPTLSGSAVQPGRPDATPLHPTDPLPPRNTNGAVAVLNCSNSANNPAHVDLSTGQPGWTLTGPSGPAAIVLASNVAWSAVAGAPWIGPAAPAVIGVYTYKTQVRINPCPKGRAARIAVTYRADNIGTLFVGGVQHQAQLGTYNYGFLPASLTTKTVVLPVGTSGIQTIELRVQNTGGPTGLAANVQVTR